MGLAAASGTSSTGLIGNLSWQVMFSERFSRRWRTGLTLTVACAGPTVTPHLNDNELVLSHPRAGRGDSLLRRVRHVRDDGRRSWRSGREHCRGRHELVIPAGMEGHERGAV
jgi:hypothetical protein